MPRFVVLEHHWRGIHWDLMFEVGDVLRTWAIDHPLETGVDLPARALSDHRLAYLDDEGPISGDRGTVKRIARGVYHPRVWTENLIRVELGGDQLVGIAELRWVGRGAIDTPFSWALRLGNLD